MSSTNRSNARDAHISDYYVTPIPEVVKFIEEFRKLEPNAFDGYILDPCAGGRVEGEPMSYPEAMIQCGIDGHNITTVDIREDSRAHVIGDFLEQPPGHFDVIITNPPFGIALDIIKKALDDVKPNGWVVMLLRLNFLEGKARKEFWEKQMPKYIFVHHKRMSFTEKGGTDSIAYAHFVFHKGYQGKSSQLFII